MANGQLQDALTAPQWGLAGHDGSFTVFVNHFARAMFSLESTPGPVHDGRVDSRVDDATDWSPGRPLSPCAPRTACAWSARSRRFPAGPPPGIPWTARRPNWTSGARAWSRWWTFRLDKGS